MTVQDAKSRSDLPRKAVVTGGTAGIGLATAKRLLDEGSEVFICGRDPKRLGRAIAAFSAEGFSDRVAGVTCDVRDRDSVDEMMAAATVHLGAIDVLVNNAGVSVVEPFETITSQNWREMIDTNLTGVFNCCQAALPSLKTSERADIINLGSRAGRYAFAGGTGYCATKFGLQGLTESLFLDLHKYGIRVSLVAPGPVNTNLTEGGGQDWHLQSSDVAKVVCDIIRSDSRACLNWVEIRPAQPQ